MVLFATFILLSTGCQSNNQTESKTENVSVSDQTKVTEQITIEPTTMESTTVEPTTVEITTQAPTPPPTEAQKTKEDTLKEGSRVFNIRRE